MQDVKHVGSGWRAVLVSTIQEIHLHSLPFVFGPQGKFFEAKVCDVFPEERSIVACFPEDAGFAEACFKITYDKLVVAVGCVAFSIRRVFCWLPWV